MADNAIDRVRAAEKKADETLRAAQNEAGRLVEEAHAEAAQRAAAAQQEARDKMQAAEKAGEKANADALAADAAALDDEMQQLAGEARKKQPDAVARILDMLV